MAGYLLDDGQAHIVGVLFEATAVQDYYLALIEDTTIALSDQIGAGLTEVSGTGYARITLTRATDWSIVGALATALVKEFTVGAGGWANVNGYAVCLSSTPTTGDAIWAEVFPAGDQGNKTVGTKVQVVCKFEQKDTSE
jgi:hypothetical protein